jgi:uncharacterized paraquat-inducible protein A
MINFNFNRSSYPFLKIIIVFLLFFIASKLLHFDIISGVIGVIIVILITVFIALVLFEQINDKYRIKVWQNQNEKMIEIADNKYECGKCGNRLVKKNDKDCSNCGFKFKEK